MFVNVEAKVVSGVILIDPAIIAAIDVPVQTQKKVTLHVFHRNNVLHVELEPDILRNCVLAIREFGMNNCTVAVSGRLDKNRLVKAGIVAQLNRPRLAA